MTNQEVKTPRAAIVTGSGRGIGLAVAWALAGNGMNVCLNCSSERSLAATQKEANDIAHACGVQTTVCVADVSQSDQANQLVRTALDAFGRVDVLVNNAGITRDGLLMRMKDEDFNAVIDVNLKGTFNMCRAVAKPMMKQRYGRIVSLSSVVGVYGNAGQVNYAASKAGVIGITKSVARELASRGITANAVAPGFISTDMTGALSDKQREDAAARIACGRFGEPEDVANVVAFLASEKAGYVTGQVICIDGGLSL